MEELLYELEDVLINKDKLARLQRYEDARIQRDRGIDILNEICQVLNLKEIINSKNYCEEKSNIVRYAVTHIEEKYNIRVERDTFTDGINIKSLRRQIKIAKLGI